MQQCLNEDVSYLCKRPWIIVLLLIFVLSGISMLTVGILCNIRFPCSDQLQTTILTIGMNMSLISLTFIVIPIILCLMINCIWYKKEVLPVTTRSPLNSRSQSPSRLNSKGKTPPSPKGPIPLHGMKSFKEFHSDA
jgi:hypothetical protein